LTERAPGSADSSASALQARLPSNDRSEDDFGVALRLEGIAKRYPGTLAVDHVDFEARVGEVHALMGENGAGKSTLMKVLAGSFDDYAGCIRISGEEVQLRSPAMAKAVGIGMIYQELRLARPISIAENLLVGRLPRKHGFLLDEKAMYREARICLKRVGLDLDPHLAVADTSQHEAQLVEIAKVLGNRPCILVMDEPTSALSREEVKRLFEIIRGLRNRGLTIIYISHHVPEIFEIADRVTVLRDGKRIGTRDIADIGPADLVKMMVGKTMEDFYTERRPTIGQAVLKVRDLTRRGFFHGVNFEARSGEILGIAGLSGAGRTELARSLCGLDPVDTGRVELLGETLPAGSYPEAVSKGVSYLSEDRKVDGLFPRLSVADNIASTLARGHARFGLYSPAQDTAVADQIIGKLDVSAPGSSAEVGVLSGGNQQKVLLGKWLALEPKVLLLDEPTRGVDVKAKHAIHEAIMELADRRGAVILISSDLPELVGLSDRVLVMRNGRLTREMGRGELSEAAVLLAANGED